MVFVDKTLDDMLKEIGYLNPTKVREYYPRKEIFPKEKSYFLSVEVDSRDESEKLVEDTLNEFCFFFATNKPMMRHSFSHPGELLCNAEEWGGGIKEINYYSAPGGVVVEIIQNKNWNYEKILAKKKAGLHPSNRKKGETTDHGGGCGLSSTMDDEEIEVNYQGKSTLVLYRREVVENNIRERLEK